MIGYDRIEYPPNPPLCPVPPEPGDPAITLTSVRVRPFTPNVHMAVFILMMTMMMYIEERKKKKKKKPRHAK